MLGPKTEKTKIILSSILLIKLSHSLALPFLKAYILYKIKQSLHFSKLTYGVDQVKLLPKMF